MALFGLLVRMEVTISNHVVPQNKLDTATSHHHGSNWNIKPTSYTKQRHPPMS